AGTHPPSPVACRTAPGMVYGRLLAGLVWLGGGHGSRGRRRRRADSALANFGSGHVVCPAGPFCCAARATLHIQDLVGHHRRHHSGCGPAAILWLDKDGNTRGCSMRRVGVLRYEELDTRQARNGMTVELWISVGVIALFTYFLRALPFFWMQRRLKRHNSASSDGVPAWLIVLGPAMISAMFGVSLVPASNTASAWLATVFGTALTLCVWYRTRSLSWPVFAGVAMYAIVLVIAT